MLSAMYHFVEGHYCLVMVKNPFGLSIFYFQYWSVLYKSCRQVLTPVNNFLHLLNSIFSRRLDLLHSIHDTTRKGFLQDKSVYDLDSLLAVTNGSFAKHSPQTDDTKHWHFSIAMWINLNITVTLCWALFSWVSYCWASLSWVSLWWVSLCLLAFRVSLCLVALCWPSFSWMPLSGMPIGILNFIMLRGMALSLLREGLLVVIKFR